MGWDARAGAWLDRGPVERQCAWRGESATHPTWRSSVRKVLVPALCASAAAVPAVALAATDDTKTTDTHAAAASTAPRSELRADARHKLDTAVQRAKHERKMKLRAK